MSTDRSTLPQTPDLQFERAVFDQETPAGLICRMCQSPVASTYFDVNGQPTCPTCRDQLVASVRVDRGLRGTLTAAMAGLGAAVAGALLYYAVVAITGYEIGLIAVVVGFMVGSAVKWGSGGSGGRRFQIMAVTLTYLAVISTYVPFVFASLEQAQSGTQVATPAAAGDQQPPATSAAATPVAQPDQASATLPSSQSADDVPATGGEIAMAVALAIGVLLALPFLAGFGNVIGWVIIGIALWEAWKVNRPVSLEIKGPFQVAAAPPPPVPVP